MLGRSLVRPPSSNRRALSPSDRIPLIFEAVWTIVQNNNAPIFFLLARVPLVLLENLKEKIIIIHKKFNKYHINIFKWKKIVKTFKNFFLPLLFIFKNSLFSINKLWNSFNTLKILLIFSNEKYWSLWKIHNVWVIKLLQML